MAWSIPLDCIASQWNHAELVPVIALPSMPLPLSLKRFTQSSKMLCVPDKQPDIRVSFQEISSLKSSVTDFNRKRNLNIFLGLWRWWCSEQTRGLGFCALGSGIELERKGKQFSPKGMEWRLVHFQKPRLCCTLLRAGQFCIAILFI